MPNARFMSGHMFFSYRSNRLLIRSFSAAVMEPSSPAGLRAGAGPRSRRGIGPPRVGRGGFALGYPLDDQGRVEWIADGSPPHGAESCRGSRLASNAALFDISRLRSNLIALALLSRGTSEPRLSRETAMPSFGQGLIGRLVAPSWPGLPFLALGQNPISRAGFDPNRKVAATVSMSRIDVQRTLPNGDGSPHGWGEVDPRCARRCLCGRFWGY